VKLDHPVDRVVMGYYQATEPDDNGQYTYLESAFAAIRDGGRLHVHDATPEALGADRTIDRLNDAAARRDRSLEVLDIHAIKSYSAGVTHVVVDASVAADPRA
jgi:tRNA wybutosine-synthesizing protein 2